MENNQSMNSAHSVQMEVSYWLLTILLLIIIILGTIGNTLALLVLMRKRMRTNSVNFYLVLLSIADTFVLYTSGFKTWIRVITGFELLHSSNATCKIVIFLFTLFHHASAWLIVLVTIDRFIAVWFPFKAATICSVARARIISLITLGVLVIYNAQLLWSIHLYEADSGKFVCAPLPSNSFMNGPYNYVRLASYSLVPFAIVVVFNMCIITSICRQFRHRKHMYHRKSNAAVEPDNRLQQTHHHVAIMLLVVSFTWIFLTLPNTILIVLDFDISHDLYNLLKVNAFLMMYLNHSINFLLYCIAGKKFRKEFVAMFVEFNASFPKKISLRSSNDKTSRTKVVAESPLEQDKFCIQQDAVTTQ